MATWTEEQMTEALALAAATSLNEAARRTGVPKTTLIRRWRLVHGGPVQRTRGPDRGPDRTGEKLQEMAAEVRDRAVAAATEKVTEALTERLADMAGRLYRLADKAVGKVDVAIGPPRPGEDKEDPAPYDPEKEYGEPHDRDGAAWVRSLVGVMAQAIDKAQLLSGKPTARPEVTERYEIDITQRIISQQPDLLDSIFASDQQSRLASRSG